MKQNYTIRRTLSALPLFLLLGIFVASCSKDDPETSNPETDNTEETNPDEDSPIPEEEAHVWEYYSINEDGESVTVTSELPEYPYFNDSKIYETVYIPSTVNIDGKEYRVTSIGDDAFYKCSSLTSISIPESVTSFGDDAFYDCYRLTSISIPEGVTSIGSSAFYGCSRLTSISIPEGVTSIGNYTFWYCSSLTSISIPEGVKSIRNGAFMHCSALTSITVAANNPVYDSREGCNAIIKTSSNTLIAGCQNTIIPESVTSIGDYAFDGCYYLKSISIPEGVTSIGYDAFSWCSSLTSISIPESVTSIGEYAFYSCSSLTSISIPEGVKSIGKRAFYDCSSLTSISIPESVTSIGEYAFGSCESLTSITVAANNPVYDSREGCNAIIETSSNTLIWGCQNTIIPEGVKSIGSSAFFGCSSLTSISIPEGVTSIGSYAFSFCSSLTSIICHAEEVPDLESYVFYSTPTSDATLYVPASAIEKYKAADQWKNFNKILPIEE